VTGSVEPAAPAGLLIIGTGRLAEALLYTLAACAPRGLDASLSAIVAGRGAARAQWLAAAANARAAALGVDFAVRSATIAWDSPQAVEELVAQTAAAVILHTASLQSPWTLAGSDGWSCLVRRSGYSVTTSLQAGLAIRVARAIRQTTTASVLVNACYPDAVNPIIARLGLPVAVGVGNVAIIAAFVVAAWPGGRTGRLRVLAHHWHVSQLIQAPDARAGAPRLWQDGVEVHRVRESLQGLRLPSDSSLNWVTGATIVPLLTAMLDHRIAYFGHAPGPFGLPGGYPVRIQEGELSLDLPPGISTDEAVAWNRSIEPRDGIVIDDDGWVRYSGKTADALRQFSGALAGEFRVADIEDVAQEMLAVRQLLITA
jgi:hypothetical protein